MGAHISTGDVRLCREATVIQLHDVDLKLVRVFTTIVRCGGFSAAQAALNALCDPPRQALDSLSDLVVE